MSGHRRLRRGCNRPFGNVRDEARFQALLGFKTIWACDKFYRLNDRKPLMRKVAEYQERAADCRRRAERATGDEEKKHLEELAAAWELLAKTRKKQLECGEIEAAYS